MLNRTINDVNFGLMLDMTGVDSIKRRIQIQKELESNDSLNIPYAVVRNTLSNFHKLLEITAPEDKKTLLQLIINGY